MTSRSRRRRQKDTGNVEQRGPGKWRLRYKTHSKQVFAESRDDALAQLLLFVEDMRHGRRPSKFKFNRLADDYMTATSPQREATTVALRRRILDQHVRPAIGEVALDDLHPAHIRRLLDEARDQSNRKGRRGKPLGPTTKRNILIVVRAILAWGVQQEYVFKNVARKVEPPAEAFVERPVLTVSDVKALVDASRDTELEAVVPTAIGTGLRRQHDMRHGFASLAYAAGVPMKTISESLGHSSLAITDAIYVHLRSEQKQEKSALLDAHLDRAVRPAKEIRKTY